MIRLFTRQMSAVRQGRSGQAALLLVVTLTAAASLVFAAVYLSHLGGEKVAAADAVDSLALSAATWEARGLNVIAALNDGIRQCFGLIRLTSAVWAGLALAALTGAGLPAFLDYTRTAVRLIKGYWRTARQLAEWSERVKKAVPGLVLSETVELARKTKVAGSLWPANPHGGHDGKDTLELHLTHGSPAHLMDNMGPVVQARNVIAVLAVKSKTAAFILGVLNGAFASILSGNSEPIRMLVPESDFEERQHVRFTGTRKSDPLPIPLLGMSGGEPLPHEAWAEPYGGGATSMTWRSRLVEKGGMDGKGLQ
jgi:hypothetical protein